MDIRSSHLSQPLMRSSRERIVRHQQTENKAEQLSESKPKRPSELEVGWDGENGVYFLGGKKLTFACDIFEFDAESKANYNENFDLPAQEEEEWKSDPLI